MIWSIRTRADFSRLTRDGRRIRAGALRCTFLLDPSASPPRVAFALGRAVGPATVRNRLRRRLRQLLREVSLPPGWYLISAGAADIVERPFDALATDVRRLIELLDTSPGSSA